jgi:ribonuclease P protein component
MEPMPYSYKKSERLRKNNEFVSVIKAKRLSIDGLSLFYSGNETGNFRIGISVGKKLGNAVKRNRLRRQIRACLMRALKDRAAGYDLVFVARRELVGAPYDRITKAVEKTLQRTAFRDQKAEGAAP